jgi:hypothetical protein
MIKEALDFILGLQDKRPVTVEVDGNSYAVKPDRTLGDVIRKPAPIAMPTLNLSTLTGFVDAFHSDVDEFPGECAVQVVNHEHVALIALKADEFGRRHTWLSAKSAEVIPFRFENYYEQEALLIALQMSFAPSENLTNLLRVCSNLKAGNSVQTADDGFSQTVVIQEGGVTSTGVTMPSRIGLAPYRTFREVAPIESDFLVRMQGKKDSLPLIALFPVDGGGWKHETALAVKAWLVAALPEATVIA